MRRTGGFAGVDQTIVVAPDGQWSFSDKKSREYRTGRLTADQHATFVRLAPDPQVAQELRPAPAGPCRDAFQYALTIGQQSGTFDDCGTRGPAVQALIAFLVDTTPF